MTYDPIKAAQVIAHFSICNERKPIDVLKVIKLIYLADRESLKEFGEPILDESRVSMQHGPVNSSTYDLIKDTRNQTSYDVGQRKYFNSVSGSRVELATQEINLEDLDELCEADVSCLNKVWGEYGEYSAGQLRNMTHDKNIVPEYENPGYSSRAIPLKKILWAVGSSHPKEQAEHLAELSSISAMLKDVSKRT